MPNNNSHNHNNTRPKKRAFHNRRPTKHGEPTSNKPSYAFRFLDLPAELRNAIYEEYTTSTISIRIDPRGQPIWPNLIHACRQIRREYMPYLHSEAFSPSVLVAQVLDFDFGPLQKLLQSFRPDGRTCELRVVVHWMHPRALVERYIALTSWCSVVQRDVDYYNDPNIFIRNVRLERLHSSSQPLRAQIYGQSFELSHEVRVSSVGHVLRFQQLCGGGNWLLNAFRLGDHGDAFQKQALVAKVLRAIVDAEVVAPERNMRLKRRREEKWMGWVIEEDERKGKRAKLNRAGKEIWRSGGDARFL